MEVISAKRLGRGPLGPRLLYSLLDDRRGGGAMSARGLNSMAQAGHGAGGRPIRALGKVTSGCRPSEGPHCASRSSFLKSQPPQVHWGQKQATF